MEGDKRMENSQKLMWLDEGIADINLTNAEMVKILSIEGFGTEEEVSKLMEEMEDFSATYYIERKIYFATTADEEIVPADKDICNDYKIVLCVNGQIESLNELTIYDGEEESEVESFIDTYYGI